MSDVIIVGGGPAGTALAILLGRRGLHVELFEQAHFPREKACGEGILPPGVEVLSELGLGEDTGGHPLDGVRYYVGNDSLRAGFAPRPDGSLRRGLGRRRRDLDTALWRAAAGTPGVVAHQGAAVEAPLQERGRVRGVIVDGQARRAHWVVAADGSRSILRRKLGLEHEIRPRRVGVRAHFRRAPGAPALGDIQVFLRDGYELYVTPLPDGELLVAALAHEDAVSSLRRDFWNWCAKEALLCQWLEDAVQISELMGRAPLVCKTAPRCRHPGLIFLGDASSSVDPITAGGISLALTSADLLAAQMPGMLLGSRLAHRRFERCRARAVRVHRMLGRGLLVLGQSPRAADRARDVLQAWPAGMDSLVGVAARRPAS